MKEWIPIIILFFLFFSLQAQIQQAELTIGSIGSIGNAIIQTSDGGFAVAGTTSYGAGGADFYIVKIDNYGNLQWTRTVGGNNNEEARSIVQANDGSYVIAGPTYSYGAGNSDFYIVKLDNYGNLEWARTLGDSWYDEANSVIQTSDGNFVISGYSSTVSTAEFYIAKFDGSGNIIWNKILAGGATYTAYSATPTKDGGFIVVGSGNGYFCSVKFDINDNIQWVKYSGTGSGDDTVSVIQNKDKGYTLVGRTYSPFYGGGKSALIVNTDSMGNVRWTRIIGGDYINYGSSVIESGDNGFVISGLYQNDSLFLFKLDETGNLIWSKTIGEGNLLGNVSMIQTNDNGLAITCPNILGYDGVIILKLDSEYNSCTMQTNVVPLVDTFNFDSTITPLIGSRGTVSSGGVLGSGGTIIQYCLITAGVEYNIKSLEFTIFPNPNNGTFHLEYSFPDNEKLEFVIYDIAGRELRKYILRPGKNSISINMEGLEEGFYIYQIRGNGYGDLMGKITVINNQR